MTPPSRPGGFEGDLEALSVVEIVQTLNLGGRTARVLLRSSSRTGAMWFRDGAMTHATTGSLLGDLAVYEMIEWGAGRFQVAYGATSETRSIAGDTTQLLLEALRRVDERSSGASAAAREVEVPPVLEADVRRERSRRVAFALAAVALVLGAIATVVLREWDSPADAGALAAVVAPPAPPAPPAPSHAAPAARRPATVRPRPADKAVVGTRPPARAPESPLAEAPVPDVISAGPEPVPAESTVASTVAPARSRVRISGRTGASGGTLQVLVDGTPVFTCERLDSAEPFETEIAVTPGEHLIVARLEGGTKAGAHEDSARGIFAEGETRLLRVTANRTFGAPVKVKLGRPLS